LKLTGLVTGIRTDFKHRHDDDFDLDGLPRGGLGTGTATGNTGSGAPDTRGCSREATNNPHV
jgi:hypothetical protein